jgi:hypothetical protein
MATLQKSIGFRWHANFTTLRTQPWKAEMPQERPQSLAQAAYPPRAPTRAAPQQYVPLTAVPPGAPPAMRAYNKIEMHLPGKQYLSLSAVHPHRTFEYSALKSCRATSTPAATCSGCTVATKPTRGAPQPLRRLPPLQKPHQGLNRVTPQ